MKVEHNKEENFEQKSPMKTKLQNIQLDYKNNKGDSSGKSISRN